MSEITIDINCDIGEIGILHSNQQLELLEYVSSCNIATGFHAGDPYTAYQIIRLASEKNISIGAHPSYPDLANFGRRSMNLGPEELLASLIYQVSALQGLCTSLGAHLSHLKLHGALYHDAHQSEETAAIVIKFIKSWPGNLILYGLSNTILAQMAESNDLHFVPEAFPDRRYNDQGSLLPRSEANAVVVESKVISHQALEIIRHKEITTSSGIKIPIEARTLCIHGDHPDSIPHARDLMSTLKLWGISIKPPQV